MAVRRVGPGFLSLPPEIREEIYRLILKPAANRQYHADEYTSYHYGPAMVLFQINRQIYIESRKVFRDLNVFVRIETPWPDAHQHVAFKGHVPILISRARAARFQHHSLTVSIDVPEQLALEWDTQEFIILLDDLEKFTRMWFYEDLSHPGLNQHLRLQLSMRDPFAPPGEADRMNQALQRRLLLPFGEVKNLHSTEVDGEIKAYPAIEDKLRKTQAEPHLSPEHCLREATRLKFEGNAELNKGRVKEALKLYDQAWRAMHVVVKGKRRHIHADAFFGRVLSEEPFRGKNGQAERLILRVHLVANTCQAYLKLEEYEQCRFWGMRSIQMLREAMGVEETHNISPEDEAVLGFPAADQMGKIYYRAAVANKMLNDEGEARKLLQVARVYLPNDLNIRKEIAATALKLG